MKTYTVTRGCTTAGQGNPVGWTRIVCNEEELKLLWPDDEPETYELVEKEEYDKLETKYNQLGKDYEAQYAHLTELLNSGIAKRADKLAEAFKFATYRHHTDCHHGCVEMCPIYIREQALKEYRGEK